MATYTILPEGGGIYSVRVKELGVIPGEYFGPFTSEVEAKRWIANDGQRFSFPITAIRNNP